MLKFTAFIKGLLVQNSTDRTKELAITVDDSATTDTTTTVQSKQTEDRVLNLPDASGELVEKDHVQTLTNKTIDGTAATGTNDISNDATKITYDNVTSGLDAITSQQAIDEIVEELKQNLNIKMIEGGDISLSTNDVTLSSSSYIQIPGLQNARNEIEAQTINFPNDGDVAVVTVNRDAGVDTTLAVSIVPVTDAIPSTDTMVIARRVGSNIYVGVNSDLKLSDGETHRIDDTIASGVDYDNTASGLTANKVQGAIDEVEARVDVNETIIAQNTADIAQEIVDRIAADVVLQTQITSNDTDIAQEITDRTDADTALQTQITSNDVDITANTTLINQVNDRSNRDRDMYLISNATASHSMLGELEIDDSVFLQVPGLDNESNEIIAQTITLQENEVAYIDINRGPAPATRIVMVDPIQSVIPSNDTLIIARRLNDIIYFGYPQTTRLSLGDTRMINESSTGGSSNGRLVGDSDISVALIPAATPIISETVVSVPIDLTTVGDTTPGAAGFIGNPNGAGWSAQTFIPTNSGSLNQATLYVATASSTVQPGASMSLGLYTDNGGQLGTLIASSDIVAIPSTSTQPGVSSLGGEPITFTFGSDAIVDDTTTYWFAINPEVFPISPGINEIGLLFNDSTNVYADGASFGFNGTSWVEQTGDDCFIEITANVEDTNAPTVDPSLTLTIGSDIYYQTSGMLDDRNTIEAQTIPIQDGEVAHINVNSNDTQTIVSVSTDLIDSLDPDPSRVIIARRLGDKVIFGNPQTIIVEDGQTFNLCENPVNNGQFDITQTLTGSVRGDSGSTSSVSEIVTNFQNIANLGDILQLGNFDVSTGTFTVIRQGVFSATGTLFSASGTTGPSILINGVALSVENGSTTSFSSSSSWSGFLVPGDTVQFSILAASSNNYRMSISGVATEARTITGLEVSKNVVAAEDSVFIAQYTTPWNVDGGTKVAGNSLRTFNNIKQSSTWAGVSNSTDITLQPGIYFMQGWARAYLVSRTNLFLIDATNNAEIPLVSGFVGDNTDITLNFTHYINISVPTVFQLNHYSLAGRTPNGLGINHANAANSNVDNVYNEISILKLGDV